MDTLKKLQVLSEDSQYDLACACGTGKEDRRHRGDEGKWLYPVSLPQGGHSIIFKTLLSNVCKNDCKYCPLRADTNIRRCSLTPEETVKSLLEYYRRGKVFGMFLSSGVINNPDFTMDRINAVAKILRYKHKFNGYLHLKIIPGASDAAIEEAVSLSNAVSVNIEAPGEKYFKDLSDEKDYLKDIIRPLKLISKLSNEHKKRNRVKLSTQFIVGASNEPDSEIVKYSLGLYKRLKFNRVYFSAYQAGLGNPNIPGEKRFTLRNEDFFLREHRLYQSDFLIRQYGFSEEDFSYENDGNLSLERDPKQVWADRHPEFFPVKINSADKEELLRVPGLGPASIRKVLKARKIHEIRDVGDIGIKGKLKDKAVGYICY